MGTGILTINCSGSIASNDLSRNRLFARIQSGYGAAIYIQDNWPGLYVTGNMITDNAVIDEAAEATGGGGIAAVNTSETHYNDLHIERNTLLNNQAQNGGGVYLQKTYNVALTNNMVRENYASNYGGGILFNNSNKGTQDGIGFGNMSQEDPSDVQPVFPVMINNTLTKNYTDGWGGGLGCTMPLDLVAFNNILCSNTAVKDGNAIYFAQVKVAHLYHNRVDSEQIKGGGYWEGTGNLCEDPELDGMCHLCWNSPCANAGIQSLKINGNWYYSPDNDIDGETRPYGNTMPDIGADESEVLFVGTPDLKNLDYDLSVNPNPVSHEAFLDYRLDKTEYVMFSIYDIAGERLEVLVNEVQVKGDYRYTWDPENLPSGIYFCVLKTGSGSQTQKLIKF
ncbi:MAG: T9SS type A sorting domain-containing protein, partial [bacterium]